MLLHLKHAETTLSQLDDPPLERDKTWSKVSSEALNFILQYWHLKWSLKKRLNLVKGMFLFSGINFFKLITLGKFIENEEELTFSSYWATIFTLSRKTAFIVSCHPHKDNGK